MHMREHTFWNRLERLPAKKCLKNAANNVDSEPSHRTHILAQQKLLSQYFCALPLRLTDLNLARSPWCRQAPRPPAACPALQQQGRSLPGLELVLCSWFGSKQAVSSTTVP